MTGIGPTRLKILALVMDGFAHGKPPTYREMAAATGTALNNIFQHVSCLELDGLVRAHRGARTVTPNCYFVPEEDLP